MLLFHGVVGLSFVPVVIATLGISAMVALRWQGFPGWRVVAAPAIVTVLGALAAAPYTLSISRGWAADRSGIQHRYFGFDPWMVWTLVAALLVAAWLARRPVRRAFAERQPAPLLLTLIAAGLAGFALVVRLPIMNHVKFVYETFIPIALLGGASVVEEGRFWVRRLGRTPAVAIGLLVFGGVPLLTLVGYSIDATGRTWPALNPRPGEAQLYEWARRETPRDAVFLDRGFRSDFMVRSGRQVLLGSGHGPELAAWPRKQIEERSALMNDLYGPRAALDADVRTLADLGRPVYVAMRPSDSTGTGPDLPRPFERVYDRDGFVVYHLPPTSPSGASR
jgi:hypothetical protein